MPSFFAFQQGREDATRFSTDASPLLGRFRAVPQDRREGYRNHYQTPDSFLSPAHARHSVHIGYGALLAARLDAEAAAGDSEDDDASSDDESGQFAAGSGRFGLAKLAKKAWRRLDQLFVTPLQHPVRKAVDKWWTRWSLLVLLPAFLAVAWCAVPFPQYPLPYEDDDPQYPGLPGAPDRPRRDRSPGHGTARVLVDFWFFLFIFYGFYNLTALVWITKVFNLYNFNWWPTALGFPVTITIIGLISILAPIPIYLSPETHWLTSHNTAWVSWTFCLMAMPVTIACLILMTNRRHLGLRKSLSETQRIFTSSWWTGEPDTVPSRSQVSRRRPGIAGDAFFDPTGDLQVTDTRQHRPGLNRLRQINRRWLPASFVRFIWFCLALFVGLLAYVIGEAYAEIYLRTLPHNNLETIVYVYGWITTVYLLDGLTGWILGGSEGERVGSYPLSWIFKLYFMLTYQTYVRALYARLRSPSQFILLQILSSTTLIIITPITLSATFHWLLTVLHLNGQSYGAYQKLGVRNVFIRFVAENASMLTFLGSILVLHFGPNKDVYPYFAFDEYEDGTNGEHYTFSLTLTASSITWACELVASFIVAGLIRWIYGVSVVTEGKLDLAVWPELLPTSVAVVLHVLQNMLFSIIRLQFR
ncbi:hypothetical protein ACKVWC_007954 [Pyricularia oryzae]